MNVIAYEHVHIPTLIKLRAAAAPAPLPYRPRPQDVIEFEADDHVQHVVLSSELEG